MPNGQSTNAKLGYASLLIDNNWVAAEALYETVDPHTGQKAGTYSLAREREVQLSIQAARKAYPAWAQLSVQERSEHLSRVVRIMRERFGSERQITPLKSVIHREMGKPLPEVDIEVMETADMMQFYVDQAPKLISPRHVGLNAELWPNKRSLIRFEPFGVVGVIKPWNYPYELPMWSIGAALICGNTVVFKASELTPGTAIEMGKIFLEAELPAGVINILTGDAETGRLIVGSDLVDLISFTGSVQAGKDIALRSASFLRKVNLELGGKDTAIVCSDADLELASNGVVWGAFANCGQVCTGTERLLVDKSIADDFIARVVRKAAALRLGVDIGPLASFKQLSKVEGHVKDAIQKGAKILLGGRRSDLSEFQHGFYFEPTIISDVNREMLVISEESFGPLLPVQVFTSLADAISQANQSTYGLGTSIWTQDPTKALEIADRMQVGMVWINDVNVAFPEAPWSGRKSSGGGIELSELSLLEYCRPKHINTDFSTDHHRAWWFPYEAP
jgi:betaine-aldehyde dehydrogenase